MKADLFDLEGKKIKTIDLPIQFNEEIRPDLIKKAVLAVQSNNRQSYGASHGAGTRASALLSRRRRDFKTSYGHGISRVPRKTLWRRGTQFGWVGAFAPGMVGGRRSHPPKPGKNFFKKLSIKERRKAIRSALSASKIRVIDSKFEKISKTNQTKQILEKFGYIKSKRKIRAGKGKSRARKYKFKKGPLIILSEKCEAFNSCKNIQGINVSIINFINAELLAPGTFPGREIIITEKALEKLDKEKLFLNLKKEIKK